MYKDILLCTDGSPAAGIATDYAIWFARQLRARLRALYITDIRLLEGPWTADLSGALGAQPYAALLPRLEAIQVEKAATILAAVTQRCAPHQVVCQTTHETGPLVTVMLAAEQNADLVVLGQRGEHLAWTGGMLGSSVERLVRASVKPCLVTPAEFREINHLLVAYDGSNESGKALRAGFELAAALKKTLTIVTAAQPDQEPAAAKVLGQAQALADARHQPVQTRLLHGHAEGEILKAAAEAKADLIVMGAYGHTRIREFVLGSVTQHLLRKATVPVLLARG